ncbi:MAG: hypothetical protein K2Y05_00015 [Hyphomicrobiaceae bacterium]|nr:hypothetical protein [Hyphomicrobiaceae bacterium]
MDGQRLFPPRVPATRQARPDDGDASAAIREIELWTTRDGREIPLDEMSDEHIANAVRVLSKWRSGLKRVRPDDPVIGDLDAALDRFKRLERDRRRAAKKSGVDRRSANSGGTPPSATEPREAHSQLASRLKPTRTTEPDGDRSTNRPQSKWPKRSKGR